MKGQIILSHGSESGPEATKVSALAAVAEALGWQAERPDYRDLDVHGYAASVEPRLARLREHVKGSGRLLLAGSSMGAFVSALASLELPCDGLFLIALPIELPGYVRKLAAARVPTAVVHGWRDELCPVDAAIEFARARAAMLVLVDDTHRLSEHVNFIAEQFRLWLFALDADGI